MRWMLRRTSASAHCFARPRLWSLAKAAECCSSSARSLSSLSVPNASANSEYSLAPPLTWRCTGLAVYLGTRGWPPASISEQSTHFLYASTMIALSTVDGAEKQRVNASIAALNRFPPTWTIPA